MNITVLAVGVIAIAVVVLVITLVPAVLQLRKTLAAGEELFKGLNVLIEEEVKPAVKSLNGALQEAEGVAKGAREGVEKIDNALEAVREVGDTIRSINSVLEKAVRAPVVNAAAWITGIKVGILTLVEALKHPKSKEVE